MEPRIVPGRAFQHPDEGGSLGEGKIGSGSGKIFLGGAFNTEGPFSEGNRIQV